MRGVAALIVPLLCIVGCTWSSPSAPVISTIPREASIHVGGLDHYFLVVSRAGFDAIWDAASRHDQRALALAFSLYETIPVVNGQRIRVLRSVVDAVEVELLEGTHAGRHGWLPAAFLDP
jgi:hypothetical protein